MTVSQYGVPAQRWVLRAQVVEAAIRDLQGRSIHETLPAYLHLRRRAHGLGRFSDLRPDWNNEPAEWMDVPGGPPGKPYFRPFTSRGAGPDNYWLNRNLAGSYAKSSLRKKGSTYIDQSSDTFALPVDAVGRPDPGLILSEVFKGDPLPAWALGAFIFRNRLFESLPSAAHNLHYPSEPTWDDITGLFFEYIGFAHHERVALFTLGCPANNPCEEWVDA